MNKEIYKQTIIYWSKFKDNILKEKTDTSNYFLYELTSKTGCTDEFILYLKITNDRLVNIKYTGKGCSISTSLLNLSIETFKGLNLANIQKQAIDIKDMLMSGKKPRWDIGEFVAFSGIHKYYNRIDCGTLALDVFTKGGDYGES